MRLESAKPFVERLAGVFLEMHARDPDASPALGSRPLHRALRGERPFVLRDLIALRQIGIEVVLPREDRRLVDGAAERERRANGVVDRAAVQHRQRPGSPMHTGQTWVLGGAPNAVLQPQKIFDAVSSCAWTSRPMTGFELHGYG